MLLNLGHRVKHDIIAIEIDSNLLAIWPLLLNIIAALSNIAHILELQVLLKTKRLRRFIILNYLLDKLNIHD